MTNSSPIDTASIICLIIAAPAALTSHLFLYGIIAPTTTSVIAGAALLLSSITLSSISIALTILSIDINQCHPNHPE